MTQPLFGRETQEFPHAACLSNLLSKRSLASPRRRRGVIPLGLLDQQANNMLCSWLFSDALAMTEPEVVALRMYTGPCFILYNGALRAMATGGVVACGPSKGQPVKGSFVTTIHAINSGALGV